MWVRTIYSPNRGLSSKLMSPLTSCSLYTFQHMLVFARSKPSLAFNRYRQFLNVHYCTFGHCFTRTDFFKRVYNSFRVVSDIFKLVLTLCLRSTRLCAFYKIKARTFVRVLTISSSWILRSILFPFKGVSPTPLVICAVLLLFQLFKISTFIHILKPEKGIVDERSPSS